MLLLGLVVTAIFSSPLESADIGTFHNRWPDKAAELRLAQSPPNPFAAMPLT
jgi:hypothetical protein